MSRPQKIMAALMSGAFLLLAAWLVPEIKGIIDGRPNDTYSEIITRLPWPAVIAVSVLHLIAGVLFVWSAGHFIEHRLRRKSDR